MADDLAARVHSFSLYFDGLVELIPAKVYVPIENVDKPWVGGMSKKQKAEAKKKTKENLKRARRNRLDPEKCVTTLEMLQQKAKLDKEESAAAAAAAAASQHGNKEVDRAKSNEELRERLRKRLEAIRAQRNADSAAATAKKAREWHDKKKKDSKKRKSSHTTISPAKRHKTDNNTSKTTSAKNSKPKSEDSEIQLEFGRVKIDSDKQRSRKQTKEKLLQQARKLEEKMHDPAKGKEISEKHSWSAAVKRAAGVKVFDDPKLLKQSIKKDKQRREKSSQKWQERKESEKQKHQEKQQSRSSHIKERIEAKKERAIAKREKKLMRPGFEGRKQGFING